MPLGSFLLAIATAKPPPVALPPQAAPVAPLPPPVAPLPPPVAPQTGIAAHFPWLTHGIAGIFVLSAVLLIVLLAVQTTKQEGLTGSIGGRVESAYRGRLGAEEQLKRITGFIAIVFVISAFVLSLTGI
jgi:preprotein translocase subunit SecG